MLAAFRRQYHPRYSRFMDTITPTQLAVELWGRGENDSHSRGAREIRRIARELFPADAPGKGGRWHLTPAQASAIRSRVFKQE